jgi:trk system potassium uptake protein TrkA
MAEKFTIGVIGLGKFGYFLGKRLVELGHEVVGMDSDEEKLTALRDDFTQVFGGDAGDGEVLKQLGFQEFDHVLVSIGSAMEASILACMHLVEMEKPKVWAKAVSWDHERVLRKIGVHDVFFPERYAAHQISLRLSVPGLIEFLPYGPRGLAVREFVVEKWAGKTLRELDLSNTMHINVVTIRKAGSSHFIYLPKADQVLEEGDVIVAFTMEGEGKELQA